MSEVEELCICNENYYALTENPLVCEIITECHPSCLKCKYNTNICLECPLYSILSDDELECKCINNLIFDKKQQCVCPSFLYFDEDTH